MQIDQSSTENLEKITKSSPTLIGVTSSKSK
jgi:hypothetical protein